MMPLRAFALAVAACLGSSQALAVGVAVRNNRPYPVGTEIEFAANGVGEADLTYTWDFGDGTKSEASADGTITHVYDSPGHYPVVVVAQDGTGSRSDSFLQAVHRVLPDSPPRYSATIIYDAARARVCNVNSDNDTVSCLSTDSLELLFEVPVGHHPRSLALSPDGTLWVTNQDDATVSVLSVSGDTLGTLSLPRASMPFGIVIEPTRSVAFVTLQAIGVVAELSLTDGAILRRADAGPWATGLALDASSERLFVSRFISTNASGEVRELNVQTLEVVRTIELAMDPGPDTEASARGVPNYLRSVVPSPDGTSLWVPSKKDNILRGLVRDGEIPTFETSVRTIVSKIDLRDSAEVLERRIDMNNRALALDLCFSALGDYAFVALEGSNGMEVIDAYSGKIVGGAFELGKAPDGLVLDDNGRLYVHSFLSRSIVVLDAAELLASTDFAVDVIDEVTVSFAEKLSDDVLFGKQVFYEASDPRMSQDGYISCATCHIDGFEDGRVWDFTDRGEGLRNTTSLLGKRGTGQGPLHWTANFDEIQDFEHDIRGPFGGTGFLDQALFDEGSRGTTLGDEKAGYSVELDALAAYVSSLDRVNPSPFRQQDGTLTTSGWRGLELFQSSGCPECHSGSDFTDSPEGVLHDVGTITEESGSRLGGTLEGFDTPSLRGIWQTAPYLHDGSASTLREVIVDKNPDDLHGVTTDLSDEEIEDLVSYLLQIDNTALEDEEAPEPASGGGDGGSDGSTPGDGGGDMGGSPSSPGSSSTNKKSKGCSLVDPGHGSMPSRWTWVFMVSSILLLSRRRNRRSFRAHE